MEEYKNICREAFMNFFRDDEKLNELTVDDRVEIFQTILVGNSDITKKLLEDLIRGYCVEGLEVREESLDK